MRGHETVKPEKTKKFSFWRHPLTAIKVMFGHDYNKISPELYEAYVDRNGRRTEQGKEISQLLTKYVSPQAEDGTKKEVLDIAAGTGKISQALDEQGYAVTALDLSSGALHALRQKLPHVKIENKNMNKPLPFEDNSFDAATSVWSNRYIKPSDSFLKEVYRVLKTDGVFIWPIFLTEGPFWKLRNGLLQHTTSKKLKEDALAAGFSEATVIKRSKLDQSGRGRIPLHVSPRYLVLKK